MVIKNLKEKFLYTTIKDKDKESFLRAYDIYINDIYRYVFYKVSNVEETEDITSEVFLKAWNYIQNNNVREFKTLKSLFYKIARNLIIDHYRTKSIQQNISLEGFEQEIDPPDPKQNIHHQIEISSDIEIVNVHLDNLKDEYREVIVLRYINELSISEISIILNKPKSNIRVLIHRAIKTLQTSIKKNNEH